MKRVSYIVFGLFILAVSSCQKEVIAPVSKSTTPDVEWKSIDIKKEQSTEIDGRSNAFEKSSSGSSSDSGGVTATGGASSSGTAITDPNNDPDSAKKKGK